MSTVGLSSALGAAYNIKKSENITKVSRMSNEEIWMAINNNPSEEEINYHMARLGYSDRSQLYAAVDNFTRQSFLGQLNAALDAEYSGYAKSLAQKANGNLFNPENTATNYTPDHIENLSSTAKFTELVSKLGSDVYKKAVETPTKYSLSAADSPTEGGYTANQANQVHNWYIGAANSDVITAVYDRLFGGSTSGKVVDQEDWTMANQSGMLDYTNMLDNMIQLYKNSSRGDLFENGQVSMYEDQYMPILEARRQMIESNENMADLLESQLAYERLFGLLVDGDDVVFGQSDNEASDEN